MPDDRENPISWHEWRDQHQSSIWRFVLIIEWAMEWVVYWLSRWAFIRFLEYAGKFTILVVVIMWFLEADERQLERENRVKEKHYRAWELIYTSAGKKGEGGRIAALEDLNADGVSLSRTPLVHAYLVGVSIPQADLVLADLSAADLTGAVLAGADLTRASLSGAVLAGADLTGANLTHAILNGADLSGAVLRGADLTGAILRRIDLTGACGDERTKLPEDWTIEQCPKQNE